MSITQIISYIAAALCLVGMWLKAIAFFSTYDWTALGILIFYASFCRFFLFRQPSRQSCQQPIHWMIALAGTWLPLTMELTHIPLPDWQVWVGRGLQLLGLIWMNITITQLGRGFGIIAALRQVQTKGCYRWIRHPLYAAELLNFMAFWLLEPNEWNGLIFLIVSLCQYLRAKQEELVLQADPLYNEYLRTVNYRFIPGIV